MSYTPETALEYNDTLPSSSPTLGSPPLEQHLSEPLVPLDHPLPSEPTVTPSSSIPSEYYWAAGGFIVLIGIAIGVFFLVKKFTGGGNNKPGPGPPPPVDADVSVTINLTTPKVKLTKNFTIKNSKLTIMNIYDFYATVLNTTKIIPDDISTVFWKSISINGNAVTITSGQLDPKIQTVNLSSFLNGIPSSITINASYTIACRDVDKQKVASTCDPCTQHVECTDLGWVCVQNTTCPADFSDCCAGNPKGIFATCTNGVITCGPCPAKDCPPDCKGTGPVCTKNGMVCSEGVLCPPDSVLQTCNLGCKSTEKPVCVQTSENSIHLQCSKCGDAPSCPSDCNMSGLLCEGGKNMCMPHVTCPTDPKVLQSCCTDWKYPIPYCDTPGPGAQVRCKDCSDLPKPPQSPDNAKCYSGSCQGHGWVCSANGWECKPHVICPTEEQLKNLNCNCPTGNNTTSVLYCDTTTNCMKCKCSDNTKSCATSDSACLDDETPPAPGSCAATCCDISTPCQTDPVSGKCICCQSAAQVCYNSKTSSVICCPDDTVCTNGECTAICGTNPDGTAHACTSSQQCVVIENMSDDDIAALKKKYPDARVDSATHTGYVCMDNNSTCNISINPTAVPSIILNYYPCTAFPSDDQGIGYCAADPSNKSYIYDEHCMKQPLGQCENDGVCQNIGGFCVPKQTSLTKHCVVKNRKDCAADNACLWRDPVEFLAENQTKDGFTAWELVQRDLSVLDWNVTTKYCDPTDDTTSFQRIITFPTTSCSWEDCWTRLAQPDVNRVVFDEKSGNCVALQNCGKDGSGYKNSVKEVQNGKVVNVANSKLADLPPQQSTSFPSCKSAPCPITTGGDYQCDATNGNIISGCNSCSATQTCIGNGVCICPIGFAGHECNFWIGSPTVGGNETLKIGGQDNSYGNNVYDIVKGQGSDFTTWIWNSAETNGSKICALNDDGTINLDKCLHGLNYGGATHDALVSVSQGGDKYGGNADVWSLIGGNTQSGSGYFSMGGSSMYGQITDDGNGPTVVTQSSSFKNNTPIWTPVAVTPAQAVVLNKITNF